MCHCPGGVAFRAATPWRNRGMSDIPQSAVKELANFCDVSSSHELRTNPPAVDGSTKVVERGWCCNQSRGTVRRLMQPGGPGGGVTPCPKAHNYRACRRPDRSPRPDRKGGFTADAPVPETGGRPSPICFSPGKDSCTRQATTRPLCSKRIVGYAMAEHMRTELVQNALQNWRFGTASPSRV